MSTLRIDSSARAVLRAAFALLLGSFPNACGIRAAGVGASEPRPARDLWYQTREVIGSAEIAQIGSVYDLISTVRPEFLRPRSDALGRPTLPAAYVDGVPLADLDMLRLLQAAWVVDIRYLRAPVASARLRRNLEAGAILITTKR